MQLPVWLAGWLGWNGMDWIHCQHTDPQFDHSSMSFRGHCPLFGVAMERGRGIAHTCLNIGLISVTKKLNFRQAIQIIILINEISNLRPCENQHFSV